VLRKSATITAVVLTASLALTGCAADADAGAAGNDGSTSAQTQTPSGEASALDAVRVLNSDSLETRPIVSFETPFEVEESGMRVISEGDGDELVEGMEVSFHAVSYLAHDGTEFFSTYDDMGEQRFTLGSASYSMLNEPLIGARVGAQVLLANPTQLELEEGVVTDVTILTLFTVISARHLPTRAWGAPQTPAEGLPVVTLAEDGMPSIEIPEGFEPTADLVVDILSVGDGEPVPAGSRITIQYTGWTLDGNQFDSSWPTPVTFPLNGLIQGWQEGLADIPVGSQVLLVIPPELGYGDRAAGAIPPNSTLVFVVDILDFQN
jgi:peptidylprolyl isomerase